jgi:ketosteroid isomerase-like protein
MDNAGLAANWQTAYNSGNLAAVAALYAEDGCRMPPNMPIVEGRDAILKSLEEGAKMGMAGIEIAVTQSTSSGDLATASGTFKLFDADGVAFDHGKWMNNSRRVDGSWHISCDIWNSDQAAPASME